jgi:hypothetical protein
MLRNDVMHILLTFSTAFEITHFTNIMQIYRIEANTLSYFYYFFKHCYKMAGIVFEVSGKFGRRILVKKSTRKIKYGLTGSHLKHGCSYGYVQAQNITGAFGMHL